MTKKRHARSCTEVLPVRVLHNLTALHLQPKLICLNKNTGGMGTSAHSPWITYPYKRVIAFGNACLHEASDAKY